MNRAYSMLPVCLLALLSLTACAQSDAPGTANAQVAASTTAAPRDDVADSGRYQSDAGHAYITFFYSHKGYSKPFLRFRSWQATLDYDADDLAASTVSVTIDTASIDSAVDGFDKHLRSDDFFDVEKYPQATFASTSFATAGDGGQLTGDLTIKGISKPVTLDVTFNKSGIDSRSQTGLLGFSARGKIQRSQWDLGKYAPTIGDEVNLLIEVEFEQPTENPATS